MTKTKRLIIDTYWEKVDRTGCKPGDWGTLVKGKYVLKSSVDQGLPWPSLSKFARQRKGKLIKTDKGWAFRFEMPTYFGIRSYQLVYPIGYE